MASFESGEGALDVLQARQGIALENERRSVLGLLAQHLVRAGLGVLVLADLQQDLAGPKLGRHVIGHQIGSVYEFAIPLQGIVVLDQGFAQLLPGRSISGISLDRGAVFDDGLFDLLLGHVVVALLDVVVAGARGSAATDRHRQGNKRNR
jgi:hypothetical protein